MDESFLTGESIAAKSIRKLREDIGIAERSNMAFAGSTIISGRGKGIVVGTGINTQVGIISQNVTEGKSAKPPLILRIEKFTRQITLFTVVLSIILGIMLRLQGNDFMLYFSLLSLWPYLHYRRITVALTVACQLL
jgi:magnesium-transporting ATPase (P-type)